VATDASDEPASREVPSVTVTDLKLARQNPMTVDVEGTFSVAEVSSASTSLLEREAKPRRHLRPLPSGAVQSPPAELFLSARPDVGLLTRAAPTTPDILVATGVHKTYRSGAEVVDALRDVNLSIHEGEFVSIMGPSGSGKTTLLNCLSGLDDIDAGSVCVGGEDLHRMSDARRTRHRASAMGFVFQAFNLIPVFSAVENVELPLLLAGRTGRDARNAATETLQRVGLGHRLSHRPSEMSGGEQQRVAIARALASRPQIVWADEPTGNLDSETAASVMGLLHHLHEEEGLTLVLVTHDPIVGASAQRRVVVRDGRIVADERLR
jgi:putative ABC transport system ATP-binding protein